MMELIEPQEDHIVGLHIDGKVDNETFDRVLAEIEDRLTRHDKIRLYVELVSLGGIGLEALFKDMKFGQGGFILSVVRTVVMVKGDPLDLRDYSMVLNH